MIDLPLRFEMVASIDVPLENVIEVGEFGVRTYGYWVPYSPEAAEDLTGIPADQLRARFGDTISIKIAFGGVELRKGQPDHADVLAQVSHIIQGRTVTESIKRGPAFEISDELLADHPPPTAAERAEDRTLIAHLLANLPEPEPIAAPTADEILANLTAASRMLPTGPVPARVEVGPTALAALWLTIPPAGAPPTWTPPRAFDFGLPIVEDASLPPLAWRVIDSDGNVMCEGAV